MIPETMKAAVYLGTDHIEVREMPVPEIDDDGALVKVHACAVCGSDLRTFHYGNKRVKPGTIMAHCVYSSEREMTAMRENGVVVAHCPDSNINICSGFPPVRKL